MKEQTIKANAIAAEVLRIYHNRGYVQITDDPDFGHMPLLKLLSEYPVKKPTRSFSFFGIKITIS